MKNKIDPVEVKTYVRGFLYELLDIIIVFGLLIVILSPFIIDYFTK